MVDFAAIVQKNNEVTRRRSALDKLWARATDTTIKFSDMPKAQGDGKRMENATVDLADMESELKRAERELDEIREDLRGQMSVLTKWQHKDIIRKRFLEGKSITQVMAEIGYEWSQTNRYMREAMSIINGTL